MKAKNGKSLSAQCAGAGVSVHVPTRVSEWASGCDGRTERKRREGHRAKERGLGGETREEGKESPQVFDI